MPEREPSSAPGAFYVESHCCTACGVPQVVAPDLIGWKDETVNHCFWKKQPETDAELHQAFAIFDNQELGCHRYAGRDPQILARLSPEDCDHPTPGIRTWASATPRTPQLLLPNEESWLRRVWNMLRPR